MIVCITLNILLVNVSFPCLSQDNEAPGKREDKFVFGSLEKSLLIPGWGQFAEKRYIEGALFLSAEVFSIYKIFSHNHKGNRYYRKYQEASTIADAVRYRELTEEYDQKRNIFILAAAAVWAINLIDIYVIVKSKEKRNLRAKIGIHELQGLALSLRYSF